MLTCSAPDDLRECRDCGLVFQWVPLGRGMLARCPRCGNVLHRRIRDPFRTGLALVLAGMVLLLVATQADFISLRFIGRGADTWLVSGPMELTADGAWELGLAVLLTTIVAPAVRMVCLAYVLAGVHLNRALPGLRTAFRWSEHLRPWAMVEVFLLGALVAYTRLADLFRVDVGPAAYALGGLMLVQVAADATIDREATWQRIEALCGRRFVPKGGNPALAGCPTCTLVTAGARRCPRCGGRIAARKPGSVRATAALLIAAAILYVPANVLPVMTYVTLGRGTPTTIMNGVVELAGSGMWPLALLVFFASITVPAIKLGGLGYLLLSTRRRAATRLRARTRLYRVIEGIGRWSMIDVFVVSILSGLVRLGLLASVTPGPGAIAFCAVVILTMSAAMTFDPRLMWDAVGRRSVA
jgi:paraquat-inducible protein A